jgi:hypothetical protein
MFISVHFQHVNLQRRKSKVNNYYLQIFLKKICMRGKKFPKGMAGDFPGAGVAL